MNTDHIEDERGMVPVAWEEFNEWMHRGMPSGTIIGDPSWWASCIFQRFIKPADCPRCAELSESINNRAREQAQKTVNNGVYLDKLATLEAELSGLRARYLRMESEDAATIAQQVEQLAAAEKDAERYRFLRDAKNRRLLERNGVRPRDKYMENLDSAIDAAIAAQKGKS